MGIEMNQEGMVRMDIQTKDKIELLEAQIKSLRERITCLEERLAALEELLARLFEKNGGNGK